MNTSRAKKANCLHESRGYNTMLNRERAKACRFGTLRQGISVAASVMMTVELVHRFGHQEDIEYPEVY